MPQWSLQHEPIAHHLPATASHPVATSDTIRMPYTLNFVRGFFEQSLATFVERERQELIEGVNERCNCGRWAIYMEQLAATHGMTGYVVDVEYNRKQNGKVKTIINGAHEVIRINCDLILHSRGANVAQDNLIAVELKKHDRPAREKTKDRERLRALTRTSPDGIWVPNGLVPPEHVCGYILGAYLEVNRKRRSYVLEYYAEGQIIEHLTHSF